MASAWGSPRLDPKRAVDQADDYFTQFGCGNFHYMASDNGLLMLYLSALELRDFCALETASSWAYHAVRRAHPSLRQCILARASANGCHSFMELLPLILRNCTESVWTVCWAMLGESQNLDTASDFIDEEANLLHTALAARGSGASSFVAYLLSRPGGAVVAKRGNIRKQTALHICAHYGRAKPARRILLNFRDIDVDAKDVFGATALMEAVRQEHSMVVRALLMQRADPNTFVPNCHGHGETPLIVAVRLKNVDITRQLVAAPGIDFEQMSMIGCPFGKTALEFAPDEGEIHQILLARTGRLDASK